MKKVCNHDNAPPPHVDDSNTIQTLANVNEVITPKSLSPTLRELAGTSQCRRYSSLPGINGVPNEGSSRRLVISCETNVLPEP